MTNITVGIDASRCRSGGARTHLIGIISNFHPARHGVKEVHLWSYHSLLRAVPDYPWLQKHSPSSLNRGLCSQLFWQAFRLHHELNATGCDILFTADASSLCRFRPVVILSQDLLSYETGVMKHFGAGKARLRLLAILFLQNYAFRRADGVIFLTHYAGKVIQKSCGLLHNVAYISHGIDSAFICTQRANAWPLSTDNPIHCLYVSNTAPYKNQWVVVRAIKILRDRGYNIKITFIGGGAGRAQKLLEDQVLLSDPARDFVSLLHFVPHDCVPSYLANADIFIFASSCETFGITLLEAMAVGLPIACSNCSSLPETLQDGGVYFNPQSDDSIADAVETIINNLILRDKISKRAKELSKHYSWRRCADETWAFIVKTYASRSHD